MKLHPQNNFVLISSDKFVDKIGDIYYPCNKDFRNAYGAILELGPKCKQPYLKKGMRVIYKKFANTPFHDDETDTWFDLVCENDIIGFME